jgi:hypothetical protein
VPATTPPGAPTVARLALEPVLMPYPGDPEALQGDDVPADVPGYELQLALMREYPHQLLGAPRDVLGPVMAEIGWWLEQAPPATRRRFSDAELAGDGWPLLAQIDGAVGPRPGDAGSLFLVAPTADLEVGRVGRVAAVVQCF